MATVRTYRSVFVGETFRPECHDAWRGTWMVDWWVYRWVSGVSSICTSDEGFQYRCSKSVRLSTEYKRQGGPLMIFGVRNVGSSAIFSYRIFVTATTL